MITFTLCFQLKNKLARAYKDAKIIDFDNDSKIIIFSDYHRGDTSFTDDFANNRNIYFHAIKHCYDNRFSYCELGDGNELWNNTAFESILNAHKNVYRLIKRFHKDNRLQMIWGNHGMVYHNPEYVKKNLSTYFDAQTGKYVKLFKAIKYHESIVLKQCATEQ